MSESRFASEPGWVRPGVHRARVLGLMAFALNDDERRSLESAAAREYFSDCTEAERDVIRQVATRTPEPNRPAP